MTVVVAHGGRGTEGEEGGGDEAGFDEHVVFNYE